MAMDETETLDRRLRYRYARQAAVRAAHRAVANGLLNKKDVMLVAERATWSITRGYSVETAVAEAKHLLKELCGVDPEEAPLRYPVAMAAAALASVSVLSMQAAGVLI